MSRSKRFGPRMSVGSFLVAATIGHGMVLAAALSSQERVLPLADRAYLDAKLSPDGNYVSYQADGSLRVSTISGTGETVAYAAGGPVSYLWEASGNLLVTPGDKLLRVSRDGLTQRQLANLAGKSIGELIGVVGGKVYCTRRASASASYVSTIQLSNGVLADIITSVPGVTSVDIDASETSLLLSDTIFLFQYGFWRSKIDGTGLTTITGSPLTALARNGRWADGDKTLVYEYTGTFGSHGGGWQLWGMDGFNGNTAPITWQPRYRRGTPEVSPDGRFIATYELLTSGELRAVVTPIGGGAEFALSPSLRGSDGKISWSADGKRVVYTGTTDSQRKGDVRVFDLDRPLYLSPGPKPGTSRPYSFDLASTEAGVILFGVMGTLPLSIPGLKGTLDLDLAAFAPLVLASGASTPIQANFVTPNDPTLIGVEVAVQGLRLTIGQGLSGAWDRAAYVTILP